MTPGRHAPILITGGHGRLAQALAGAAGSRGQIAPRTALDIADEDATKAAIAQFSPRLVINAAAASNVDRCETDVLYASRANAIGPGVLARICAEHSIPFVHVSTDYVFGADALTRPREENDPPAPLNAYGKSKLLGERAVGDAGGRSVIARTAWLFGFKGCFIDRMIQKARIEKVVRLTEQVGTPTPVTELAQALLNIGERLEAGEKLPPLLHVAGAPSTTRADWVEAAFEAIHCDVCIERVDMGAFTDAATRPSATPLDTRLFSDISGAALQWRSATQAWALTTFNANASDAKH